jgi:ribonuclease T2
VASPGTHKRKIVLAFVIAGALLAWFAGREPGKPAQVPKAGPARQAAAGKAVQSGSAFDFYLLALTLHPAFCADGHQGAAECRSDTHRPLVIHGLWPERLEPRSYPHDCPAPRLDLDAVLEQQLADYMPGMAAGLHEHEWREHGGCSGLGDDEYFGRALELARSVDAAMGARLATLAGRDTTAEELRESANQFSPGIGATITLHCRTQRGSGDRPVLFEIRQCIDNDGPGGAPGSLMDCGALRRRDQGCGASFLIVGTRD